MASLGVPQNPYVQSANQQILVSWDLSAGATQYIVQRSLDNVTYTTVATVSGTPLATSYLDTSVVLGTQYWYQVAASNGTATSIYTTPQSAVPTRSGEMCLSQIRLAAMQRADRVNSNFVTLPEWRNYINQSMFELYDLLVTLYEDYFVATPIQFTSDGSTFLYPLPDGVLTFNNGINPSTTFTPQPFYKLIGVDLALNNANNAYVTVNKFQFADRNKFVYPNTASTIYGVFNLQYRLLGTGNIEFVPTPSAGQQIRLWYIPRLVELLQDTDTTTMGISGWIEYVVVKAAYYALTKEESDTTSLVMQLGALQKRIEESAVNRDAGIPDKISDSRSNNGTGWGSTGGGWNGGTAGWLVGLAPASFAYNSGDGLLGHFVLPGQMTLGYAALCVTFAYFLYLAICKYSSPISTSRSLPSFMRHISHILFMSSKKQMIRVNTKSIVATMANKQAFRNRPYMCFVAKTMSSVGFPMILKLAISPTISSGNPNPASFSFVNFIKKCINSASGLWHKESVS